jgi:hypothetical protein
VSCKASAAPAFLDIKSEVGAKKCRLTGEQDVDHKVELANYGPREVQVTTLGVCGGPRLTYPKGAASWPEDGPVPAGRSVVRRTRSERLVLGETDKTGLTTYEQVDLSASRAYGRSSHEAPVHLRLQLELQP